MMIVKHALPHLLSCCLPDVFSVYIVMLLVFAVPGVQEVHDARIEMQRRTNEWYQGLRSASSDEEELAEGMSRMVGMNVMETSLSSLRERKERQSPPSSAGSLDITDKQKYLT